METSPLKNEDATNIVVETSEYRNELPLKLEDADGPKSAPGSIFPQTDFSNPYVQNLPKSKLEHG